MTFFRRPDGGCAGTNLPLAVGGEAMSKASARVEDEMIVAWLLEGMLADLGWVVV
jgi:hypothetical protein